MLHRFWDITTFTVYVTACDLEKSFSVKETVEIIGHVHLRKVTNDAFSDALISLI